MKMKKTALVLAAVAAMAMSSVCSASIGSQLDKNDKNSTTLVNALAQKNTEASYDSVAANFSDEMKKNITAATFLSKQKEVTDKLGALESLTFVQYQRVQDQNNNDIDILTYASKFSKQNTVLISVFFDKSGKIIEFRLNAITPKAEGEQQPAASGEEN